MRRLNILTWHTHGSYLYYLSQAPHEFHVLMKPGRPPGYGGRCGPFPFGPNVHDLPAHEARTREFDCILFQEDHHWEKDQFELLTPAQRALPRIYLEHDPPRAGADTPPGAWPCDIRHPVDDPNVLLVHVTPFNALMWDSGSTPTRVIDHGVWLPVGIRYSGEIPRGLVVINHLRERGHIVETEAQPWGKITHHGLPGIPSLSAANAGRPAPWIGANNNQVFGKILGLSSKKIEELKKAEAIK